MKSKVYILSWLLLAAIVSAETCDYRLYCTRHREYMQECLKDASAGVSYSLVQGSVTIDSESGSIWGTLTGEGAPAL